MGSMGKTTFVLPDDLHNEISAAVRKRGVNINIAVNQAVNMWLGASEEQIAKMSGPMAKLNTRERKKVEKYIELIRTGNDDLIALACRRIGQFLAIANEEALSRVNPRNRR